ncbi:hypothetical protein PGUG_00885 [Meyerozyma guilliermondii ATCC 6260]|uniref:Vps72/YL1 N-terminal domain-containing protein n=1 Tax=Meyerozyma guilliermondii (strain ATCC 6260 / CBS 566 / DSM 6381 / JCM 1539 / NBRC 10279 / NRRL Y-324) TaxID=294746 RepID=A5DC80_PICGU|nr:uncharacterized protein PGUG_00885 [Meyerozyma guilliermondii ATCC 6260]EDK36787.2 hypothetical protein PGUG_00885 [Meyerozyma guilliermondii ATCC 6260]
MPIFDLCTCLASREKAAVAAIRGLMYKELRNSKSAKLRNCKLELYMAEEGLATSRARRANAGSRLKQLIAMEDDVSEKQRFVPDEEDEVALLFAEDENDEEVRSSSDDEEGSENDNEDDEDNASADEQSDNEDQTKEVSGSRKRATPDDEMLSSSDLSGSDTDESEGEKELENQEKLKKRRQRRAKTVVPAIKKLKPAPPKPKPKKQLTASESLMRSQRSSSRASAIESKQALVQKLKKDEKRRAAMAPVVRPKYVELTQEERLLEAVETERVNVKSLNEFMDQETPKKRNAAPTFASEAEEASKYHSFGESGVFCNSY